MCIDITHTNSFDLGKVPFFFLLSIPESPASMPVAWFLGGIDKNFYKLWNCQGQ